MNPSKSTDNFQRRPASWADLQKIVELRNTSSNSTSGRDVTAAHWQKRSWYHAHINLESDSLLLLDGKTAVAYVEVSSEFPFVVYEMVGAVHPAYRQLSLGSELVKWVEQRVNRTISKAPKGSAVFIHNRIIESNKAGQELLESCGFKRVRDFVYLQIQMHEKPENPIWPEGIECRLLQSTDWDRAGPALQEAFEDHWGVVDYQGPEPDIGLEQNQRKPQEIDPEAFDSAYFNSPGLCFVAWDDDEVAGLCLSNATTVEYPEAGYLGSLSVRRRWRRMGLGRALTLQTLQAFYEKGTRHVLTDTDGDSFTKAYRVYENTGMSIFRRQLVYEKCFRQGRDLLKRNMTP